MLSSTSTVVVLSIVSVPLTVKSAIVTTPVLSAIVMAAVPSFALIVPAFISLLNVATPVRVVL